MLNRVTIAGRLARDPELRHTNSGTAVASFSLAVDRDFKDQSGERITDWIDCVAWKHTAEFLCNYTQKGSLIIADGRLQVRDWTDSNGNKRRAVEVIADNVYFGDRKREEPFGDMPSQKMQEITDEDSPDLPF